MYNHRRIGIVVLLFNRSASEGSWEEMSSIIVTQSLRQSTKSEGHGSTIYSFDSLFIFSSIVFVGTWLLSVLGMEWKFIGSCASHYGVMHWTSIPAPLVLWLRKK